MAQCVSLKRLTSEYVNDLGLYTHLKLPGFSLYSPDKRGIRNGTLSQAFKIEQMNVTS